MMKKHNDQSFMVNSSMERPSHSTLLWREKEEEIEKPITMHRLKKGGLSPLLFYNRKIDERRAKILSMLSP
jgi:hypothetical protein